MGSRGGKTALWLAMVGIVLAGVVMYVGGRSFLRQGAEQVRGAEVFGIYADGWIGNGAELAFRDLTTRGNRLTLSFNPWRPAGVAPAELDISVCGVSALHHTVTSGNPVTVYLTGTCNPRKVEFLVRNPFVPSATDTRELGVQLVSATLGSRFGVPIVSPMALGMLWLGLMVIVGSLLKLIPSRWLASVLGLGTLLSWVAMVELGTYADVAKVSSLVLLVAGVLGGSSLTVILLRRAVTTRSEEDELGTERPGQLFRARVQPLQIGILIAIVVVAAALRFWGLNFGLPANYHPDEVPKVNAIMRMVDQGNLDPKYFLHPSLLLYSSYAVNTVFHAFGMEGSFRDTQFLAGRTVSALAGTLSVLLLFLVGRLLVSVRVGLVAASLLAVLPLHVTCSRYMKEDALLVCLVLLTTTFVLWAVRSNRPWLMLVCGLLAGVTASSKYTGMLAGAIVIAAPWLRSGSFWPDLRFLAWTVGGLCLMPLGFISCTPYSVLTPEKFLRDFGSERHHMMRGHTVTIDAWSQYWMYHFGRSILPGMHWFTTLVGIAGVGFLLVRRRISDLYVVALVLLFYLPSEWVKAKPEPQPERYILPCLPYLALAAAMLMAQLERSVARSLVPVLVLVALYLPAQRTVQLASEITSDTRDQMAQWMIENLPAGSKVYLDWKPYSPRFWNSEFQITHVPRATILQRLQISDLKNSGQNYLVLSGLFYERYFTQPEGGAAPRKLFRDVFERVPIVKEFAPQYGTYGFHNPRLTLFSLAEQDFARLEAELHRKHSGEIEATSNDQRAAFRWSLRK